MSEEFPIDILNDPPSGPVDFPHETLDVYRVLDTAYHTVRSWQGISWSRGTGDQLQRALSGAILRYSEGYYADGGNKSSLWRSARASIGEAATAIQILAVEGRVPAAQAAHVRSLLSRAMRMLAGLQKPRCRPGAAPARGAHAPPHQERPEPELKKTENTNDEHGPSRGGRDL